MSMLPLNHTNGEAIRSFINCLFLPDDLIEVRLIPSKQSSWHPAKALPGMLDRLKQKNSRGEHIYFGANPRNSKGGKTEHVKLARCLFADFDHADVDTVRDRLAKTGFPAPTVIVNSGHGVHCYWLLDAPLADLARWKQLQKQLAHLQGSDPKVCDPPRIMRLPGFINHKEPAAVAELIEANPEHLIHLASIEALLSTLRPRGRNCETTATSSSVELRAISYLAKCEPAVSEQGGHNQTFVAARAVVYGFDLGVDRGLQILLTHYNPACQPPWSEVELRHKCEEADSKPFDKPRGWLLQNVKESTSRVDTEAHKHTKQASCVSEPLSVCDPGSLEYCVSVLTEKRIFRYAKKLKTEHSRKNPVELLSTFTIWHKDTLPRVNFSAAWTSFLVAWPKIKHLEGEGPIYDALTRARKSPIDLSRAGYSLGDPLGVLAALCRELQKHHENKPFPLACRTVGDLFEVSTPTAWKWLVVLESLKIIHCTSKGDYETGKASEFRYLHPIP